MKLHDYIEEILYIARENDADYAQAADMFLNNVHDAGMEGDLAVYHGADQVDYAALQPHLKELQDSKESFLADYRANLAEIHRLWKAGDGEGLRRLMCRE